MKKILLHAFLCIFAFGFFACQSTTLNNSEKTTNDIDQPLVKDYKTYKNDSMTIHYPPEEQELVDAIVDRYSFSLASFRPENETHFHEETERWKDDDLMTIAGYLGLNGSSEKMVEVRNVFISMFGNMLSFQVNNTALIDIFYTEDLVSLAEKDVFIEGITIDLEERNINWGFNFTKDKDTGIIKRTGTRGFPLLFKKEEQASLEEKMKIMEAFFGFTEKLSDFFSTSVYFIVLHEVIEGEIVFNMIKSSDRRWFCDGMANAISLLVMQTHDENKNLTLDDLLEKYYPCPDTLLNKLPEMDLEVWLTAERENKEDGDLFGVPYYYLATVTMLEIIKENGEDWIPELFRRLREQNYETVNMIAVYSLFREITGKSMRSYIPRAKLWIIEDQKNKEGQTVAKQKLAEAVEYELKYENAKAIDVLNELLSLEDVKDKGRANVFFQLARIYTQEKQYEKALECYDQGLGLDENAIIAWCNKGLLLDSMERSAEAEICFEKVMKLNPKYTEHIVNQAKLFMDRKEFKIASKYCNKALKINPKDVDVWIYASVIASNMGNIKHTSFCIDKALILDQKNSNAWYNKGVVSAKGNNYEEALVFFNQAIMYDSNYVDALHAKAQVLNILKQKEEAIACFDRVTELNSKHIDAWRRKGNIFEEMDRYEEALFCYDKVLEINAEDTDMLESKGDMLRKWDRGEEALACYNLMLSILKKKNELQNIPAVYDRILKITPDDISILREKADLAKHLGRRVEELMCYEEIVRIIPEDAHALARKAWLLKAIGRNDDALKDYDLSLQIDSQNAETWHGKAVLLGEMDRNEEALICYNVALEVDPKYYDAWCDKGNLLQTMEKYEEALICYDKALETGKSDVHLLHNKACTLRQMGREEESLPLYEKVQNMDPQYFSGWYCYGSALMAMGRDEDALEAYKKAQEIIPDNENAKRKVKELEIRIKEKSEESSGSMDDSEKEALVEEVA